MIALKGSLSEMSKHWKSDSESELRVWKIAKMNMKTAEIMVTHEKCEYQRWKAEGNKEKMRYSGMKAQQFENYRKQYAMEAEKQEEVLQMRVDATAMASDPRHVTHARGG